MHTKTLTVGFGRACITPAEHVGNPMEGYSNQICQGVLKDIFATCIAITDEQDNTMLLYTVDKTESEKTTIDAVRERLSASTGIPADNISYSATHTHSTTVTRTMVPDYIDQLVKAGEEALADRVPATVQIGSYDVPDMNFVRHYVTADGFNIGDNYGNYRSPLVGHVTDADKTMRLIRFVREGKKDVLMVNWQVHPKLTSTWDTQEGRDTRYLISPDFLGYTRDYLEEKEDLLFAYYNGGSGNVNPLSRIPEEQAKIPKQATEYALMFGDHVLSALSSLRPVNAGMIRSTKAPLGDRGFELHAYTLGSIGFATVPAEIFDTTAKYIRDGSGCEMTFVLTCANGRDTYIPVTELWDYHSNDDRVPYEMRICRYPRGTAEILAQNLANMLTELQK